MSTSRNVNKLLKIASLTPNTKKPKKGGYTEAEKFVQKFQIMHSDEHKVESRVIYEKYVSWRGEDKAISKRHFFMLFKKLFNRKRLTSGTAYQVDPKPFKLTEKEEKSMRIRTREEAERLTNGKKKKNSNKEKDKKEEKN